MITNLPDEMLRHVLIFLDPVDILVNIARSNKRLASITSSDNFWRFKYVPQLFSFPSSVIQVGPPSTGLRLTMEQLQQCCVISYKRQVCSDWFVASDSDDWCRHAFGRDTDTEDTDTDRYVWPRASILPTMEDAVLEHQTGDGCCCLCSSRDRDGGEEILENVLALNDVVAATDDWKKIASGSSTSTEDNRRSSLRWWSSAPSPSNRPEDTNEVILFTTKVKAIITDVAIKPLMDPFAFYIKNTFSWPRISIKVYSLPTPMSTSRSHNGTKRTRRERPGCGDFRITKDVFQDANIGSSFDTRRLLDGRLDQRVIIDTVLGSHTPVYESPVINITSSSKENEDSWQYYSIPDGVVGNVITFTLWGKNCEQFIGSGYYVCVERVAARGVPLLQR